MSAGQTFDEDALAALPRRQLQALAKKHGVKANGKSAVIIAGLMDIVASPAPPQPMEEPVECAEETNVQQQDATESDTEDQPEVRLGPDAHELWC